MTKTLLTSESRIKALTAISDNVAGAYLRAAMFEAQDVYLKEILGSRLMAKLEQVAGNGTASGAYKTLLDDFVGDYLTFESVALLCRKLSFKITNAGVVQTPDDKVNVENIDGVIREQNYYQGLADSYAHKMQIWVLNHQSELPELSQASCDEIKAHLEDSASCGIFLGGARGKLL